MPQQHLGLLLVFATDTAAESCSCRVQSSLNNIPLLRSDFAARVGLGTIVDYSNLASAG